MDRNRLDFPREPISVPIPTTTARYTVVTRAVSSP
jgi:hypothetical protein